MRYFIILLIVISVSFSNPPAQISDLYFNQAAQSGKTLYTIQPVPFAQTNIDGYYNAGVYHRNQSINQPSNQAMDQMMRMMMLQQMQGMQQQQQQNQLMFNSMYSKQMDQSTAASKRVARRRTRPWLFTKGKVNNGLIFTGIANELLNKDSKYFDQKKGRMAVGGGLLLNNILK